MDDFVKSLEPFYGKDYCVRMTMDLEKLRDEQFQGSFFLFKKGWLRHTVELLDRLLHLGFPVRTRDHILVHLSPPVEKMTAGELYFQVGRQLPGSLSLKFTRRQPDNTMVIQPTVLEQDEECRLAADPCRYLEDLRTIARALLPPNEALQLLTNVIVLNEKCERQRINVNSFFRKLEKTSSVLPQFCASLTPSDFLTVAHHQQPQALSGTNSLATDIQTFTNESRQLKSGNEENNYHRNLLASGHHSKGTHLRHTEPEENDENSDATVENHVLYPQWPISTEEYAGTTQGVVGILPRRCSTDSTGKTSLQDEYASMTTAFSTLSLLRESSTNFQEGPGRVQRSPNPVADCEVLEDYRNLRHGIELSRDSWTSHQESDSHTGYRHSWNSTCSQTFLPIPVEELNNAAARPK